MKPVRPSNKITDTTRWIINFNPKTCIGGMKKNCHNKLEKILCGRHQWNGKYVSNEVIGQTTRAGASNIENVQYIKMKPQYIRPRNVGGKFDYNGKNLAPTGLNVIIHEKPNRRRTRGQHGVQG